MAHLHYLLKRKRGEEVLAELAQGADPNERLRDKTPLMLAAREGLIDVVRHLLRVGVDIDATTAKGTTSLIDAIEGGHEEVANLLLDEGANPNVCVDTLHSAPIVLAALTNLPMLFDRLVALGANPSQISGFDNYTVTELLKMGGLGGYAKLIRKTDAQLLQSFREKSPNPRE